MIYAHCTCEETQAALGDSGPCSFCWAGFAEDDRCVSCPHCHRLQVPHDPAGACTVCKKPLRLPDVTLTIPSALVREVANLLGRESQRLLYVRETDERVDPTPDKRWHAELWDTAKGLNELRNAILRAGE